MFVIVDLETGSRYVDAEFVTERDAEEERFMLLRHFADGDPWRIRLVIRDAESAKRAGTACRGGKGVKKKRKVEPGVPIL